MKSDEKIKPELDILCSCVFAKIKGGLLISLFFSALRIKKFLSKGKVLFLYQLFPFKSNCYIVILLQCTI